MKKIAFIVLGVFLLRFGIDQTLQLIGLIGTKTFSLAGIGLAILGLALGATCFKKVIGSGSKPGF